MRRRLLTPFGGICVFILVSLLVGGGLAYVTFASLQVEAAQREATARADAANKERLALWQLDSRLFPILGVENHRPYVHYFSLYTPHPVVIDETGEPAADPGRVPSPLLSGELPDWMRLHFQLDPVEGWSSPQVMPESLETNLRTHRDGNLTLANSTTERRALLGKLRVQFVATDLHAMLIEQEAAEPTEAFAVPWNLNDAITNSVVVPKLEAPVPIEPQSQNRAQQSIPNSIQQGVPAPQYRDPYDQMRFAAAKKSIDATRGEVGGNSTNTMKLVPAPTPAPATAMAPAAKPQGDTAPMARQAFGATAPSGPSVKVIAKEPVVLADADRAKMRGGIENLARKKLAFPEQPPAVHVGPIRPIWLTAAEGTKYLALVRAARLEKKMVFQGVILDWVKLQAVLKEEVQAILPDAKIEPVLDLSQSSERRMAAIPAQLDPGPTPELPPAGWTPLRIGLVLSWVAAIVALMAVWFGGWTLIDLSERRIRFVSAVTHELRTPLTSLRLYLDLLASGMITDEAKQKEYLHTLQGEAERLNQLVDNVLDFAKLENRAILACRQSVPLESLLTMTKETWTDRLLADGKELHVISTLPPDQAVHTDVRIASQILGILIDNARKYSREASDRRIWVWAKPGDGTRLILEVEDRGPGVAVSERASIFRPFRRGRNSDKTGGGAGLGLALAKQWADALNGRLSYRPADGGTGAIFRLELPHK